MSLSRYLILVTLLWWTQAQAILTELSNPTNSGQTLRICTSVADPVTVLTDTQPPADLAADGCYVETQPPADGKGPWAVSVTPHTPGARVVALGSGFTVELTVYPATQPADTGLGLYTDYATYGAPWEPRLFDLLHRYGCNTLTVYGHGGTDGADIARQLDTAIDSGLLDSRFPVLLIPSVSTEEDMLALSLSMRGLADKTHRARTLSSGLANSPPQHRWPELVGCNIDHPTGAQREQVLAVTDAYRRGMAIKSAAHIAAGEVDGLRDALSVAIIDAAELDGATREQLDKRVRPWAYTTQLKPGDAALGRYYAGIWSFVVRPQVALVWSAAQLVAMGPDGPSATPALIGLRDGSTDYRALRQLERLARRSKGSAATEAAAWLAGLAAGPLVADEDPPDCGAIRATALGYIERLAAQ